MAYLKVNGHNIFLEDDDFSDAWVPPRVIFMQHYIHGSSADFRAWVPTLARHARVIRMDRLGNGASERPPSNYKFTPDNIISDMIQVLDLLGIEKIHYVGESVGGCLGVLLATRHPDRVDSLTLVSTPLSISREIQEKFFIPDGYHDAPTAVRTMGAWLYFHTALRGISNHSPDDREAVLKEQFRSELRVGLTTHVVASMLDMVTDPNFTIRDVIPKVAVPTLLLSGMQNLATPPHDREYVRRNIRGSEEVSFPGVEPAWESPDEAAKATLAFILKHSASAE